MLKCWKTNCKLYFSDITISYTTADSGITYHAGIRKSTKLHDLSVLCDPTHASHAPMTTTTTTTGASFFCSGIRSVTLDGAKKYTRPNDLFILRAYDTKTRASSSFAEF